MVGEGLGRRGLQITDYGFERPWVGAWLRRALLVGEDKVKPCPYLETVPALATEPPWGSYIFIKQSYKS